MRQSVTRRDMLATGVTMGAGLLFGIPASAARSYRANGRLRIGIVGVAHRGQANLDGVAAEEITALCDVDASLARQAHARFPKAAVYSDFRRMMDESALDAVVISTPDHTHAPVAAMALRRGLHVYCEKPLTHTVAEARLLTDLARGSSCATQMGIQIHAGSNYRRVVEAIRSGAIGVCSEVHVWCGGSYSPGDRPLDTPAVPADLDWSLWLGPAPERPYNPAYVPFHWRGWWDFGNGMLGDMACHHMDLPYWALDLGDPIEVTAEGPPVHPESAPSWLIVRYRIPSRTDARTVRLTWYHGDKRPPYFAQGLLPSWGNGTLFVGDRGMLIADYDKHALLPSERFASWTPPPQSISESPGHHAEWIEACKSGNKASCDFAYAGRLTEAVLLGNVAYRCGEPIVWDAKRLAIPNAPRAESLLRRRYRHGWRL